MVDDLLDKLDAEQRELVLACGRFAAERGERAFLVGGSVRDLFLDRDHDDLDIVVEGDGLAVAQALSRSVDGELTRHHAFQTATVSTPGGLRVDVATARSEQYPRPGQLPQVVPGSLAEDLERRDFTINTMAIDLGPGEVGALIDPLGGIADLRADLIRVMHSRSFADDPTRVLRAIRFALRFGSEIETDTHAWLRQAVAGGYLADVSGDRVRKEIRLSFGEAPIEGPLRLRDEGVLREVHPLLGADETALQELDRNLRRYRSSGGERAGNPPESSDWTLRLACCASGMPPQARWELVRRLRLSRDERSALIDAGVPWRKASAAISTPGSVRDSDVERALRPLSSGGLLVVAAEGAGSSSTAASAAVASSEGTSSSPDPGDTGMGMLRAEETLTDLLWRYLEHMQEVRPELNGADLLELGVSQGPDVGLLLEKLRSARLDGGARDSEDERRLVLGWLAEKPL